MGKKGGKSSGFVSQGQRPNVSRATRNAMRRENRLNLTPEQLVAKSKREEKYPWMHRATELFGRYKSVATWAACVQAVKSDWVSQFHNKYGPKLKGN